MNTRFSSSNYQNLKKLSGSGGRSPSRPEPKIQNLMQSHIYLHALDGIDRVYLTYLDRAAGSPNNNIQFKITNHKTNEGNYPNVYVERPFGIFDYVIKNFTIESILDGYDYLFEHLKGNILPEPTYIKNMTEEQVQEAWSNGEISKTKYEMYLKDKVKYPISEWQCAWCGHLDQCKADESA